VEHRPKTNFKASKLSQTTGGNHFYSLSTVFYSSIYDQNLALANMIVSEGVSSSPIGEPEPARLPSKSATAAYRPISFSLRLSRILYHTFERYYCPILWCYPYDILCLVSAARQTRKVNFLHMGHNFFYSWNIISKLVHRTNFITSNKLTIVQSE